MKDFVITLHAWSRWALVGATVSLSLPLLKSPSLKKGLPPSQQFVRASLIRNIQQFRNVSYNYAVILNSTSRRRHKQGGGEAGV